MSSDPQSSPLLDPALFFKVLAVTLGSVVIGFAALMWLCGPIETRDIVGTLVCAPLFAYLVHVWLMPPEQ